MGGGEPAEHTEDRAQLAPPLRWDEQRAMQLRKAHRENVARNEVLASPLWARPCRGYNVQIELDSRTRSSLKKIQQDLHQAEPNLLVCPDSGIHKY